MVVNEDVRNGWDALMGKPWLPRIEEFTSRTELHVKGFMIHDVRMPDVKMIKPSIMGQSNHRPQITYFQMDVHQNFTPPVQFMPKLSENTLLLNTRFIKNQCPYYDITKATGLNKRGQRHQQPQQDYEPPDEMLEGGGDDE